MKTITIYPENKSQLSALKAMAKAMKLKVLETEEKHNMDLLSIVKEGRKEFKTGKTKIIKTADLWK